MSMESQRAHADMVAAGIIVLRFGQVSDSYNLRHETLRDMIALAYLDGQRDALAWSQRLMSADVQAAKAGHPLGVAVREALGWRT